MTTRVERPWGWYEELAEGPGYKVKRLLVKENARLSLQRHQHRSEHWVVAAGTGSVYCDGTWMDASVGNSFDIPVMAVHRAFGGPGDLLIIEVQKGSDGAEGAHLSCRGSPRQHGLWGMHRSAYP